jgi:hypothetical protein
MQIQREDIDKRCASLDFAAGDLFEREKRRRQ